MPEPRFMKLTTTSVPAAEVEMSAPIDGGGMTRPFVSIGGGHELYIRDCGTGQPILFLAGWSMDSGVWGETMVHLNSAGYRTIAYDRRGHGRSTDPGRYDYDVLADDLAAVLDTLDLSDVVVVAHSGAAGEIIRYLTRHGSQRVSRIVLVGATGPRMIAADANEPGIPPEMVEPAVAYIANDLSGWLDENIGPFAPEAHAETARWLADMTRNVSRRALIDFQRAILTSDFTAEAESISVPVVLIHGDQDVSAPLDLTARRYAALIPQSALLIYEGVAHGVMVSHASRLAKDIQEVRP